MFGSRRVLVTPAAAASLLATVFTAAGLAYGATGGPVSSTPAPWTPHLPATSTAVMQIRELAQCGSTMYGVGSFTTILQGGNTYPRSNVVSFSASTGAVTGWAPQVNGTVNSVALSADCATAYLGGAFSQVGAVAAHNLAAVSTTSGAVLTGFARIANSQVETLLVSGSHLLVGGFYTVINGSSRHYLASLNLTSGVDDGYVNLNISGHYVYTDAGGQTATINPSRVYNLSLSPDGQRLLVMGDFTSVAGQGRQQIFMLDLTSPAASLDAWYSTEFNAYCAAVEPFYVKAAGWSPDGATVYIATTGYKPATGPGYNTSDPRAGLCDAATAFPSSSSSTLSHSWINYTGCDSLYSVTTDANDVYIGGHERWANNPNGCNNAGPGALSRPGLAALSPSTGQATTWNPTRSRGNGADAMLITVTPAGLWINSDNAKGSDKCGGVAGKAGICFLPS